MRMYDIILKKRANLPLTDEEIRFVIDGYVNGEIPDYQVSALSLIHIWEPAIAIGNPLGLEFKGSVTSGVISALARTIDDQGQRFPDVYKRQDEGIDKIVLNMLGKTTLQELGALIESCDVVVTADTGALHIALSLIHIFNSDKNILFPAPSKYNRASVLKLIRAFGINYSIREIKD